MENIIDSLNWRYACKKFDPSKKLTEQQLQTLKEALNLTPMSYGLQLVKFLFVENQELKDQLVAHSYQQKQVAEASHVIVLCVQEEIGDKDVEEYISITAETRGDSLESLEGYKNMMSGTVARMSEEQKNLWASKQLYIALGNVMTVCAVEKIDACPMEGFSPAGVDEVLGLKEKGLKSVLMLPVGFRSEDDPYIQKKKVRKPLSRIVEVI